MALEGMGGGLALMQILSLTFPPIKRSQFGNKTEEYTLIFFIRNLDFESNFGLLLSKFLNRM